jgi:acetoin utilization protein AcuC
LSITISAYLSDKLRLYSFGASHPFNSSRYDVFLRKFYETSIDRHVRVCDIVPADDCDLQLFHKAEYINFIKSASEKGTGYLDHGDTLAFKGMHEASSYVVGASICALKDIADKKTDIAFIPIGGLHHAKPMSAAGFCIYNDAAIGIYKAFELGFKKVMYMDIDAHFGDGVYHEFAQDERVLTFDWHQKDIFPGCPSYIDTQNLDPQRIKNNIGLSTGATNQDVEPYLKHMKKLISFHNPDLIILQAGADCLEKDPLAGLNMTASVHFSVANIVAKACKKQMGPKVLVLGGGGYDVNNTSHAWLACLKGLLCQAFQF